MKFKNKSVHESESIARKLSILAKEKEVARQKLVVTAKKLALTAQEKETTRRKLAIVAKQLATTAKENESIRRKLVITAKQLAVTAREKESSRRKLAITAQKLAIVAEEKESSRRELAITTQELKRLYGTLEKKVLKRTKDLEQIKSRNEAILTSIGDGLVVVDKDGKISYINKSFEEMLGWKAQEIIGKTMVEVVPREDLHGIEVSFKERIFTQVLAGQKFVANLTNPFYYIRSKTGLLS